MIKLIKQRKLFAIILFCTFISSCMLSEFAPTYDDTRLLSAKKGIRNSLETDRLLETIFTNLTAQYQYDRSQPNLYKYSEIALKATEALKKLNYAGQASIPAKFCENVNNIDCTDFKQYRTFDGKCNNLKKSWYGAENTPQKRILKQYYDDGISALRQRSHIYGKSLPHPRLLAYTLNKPNPTKSVWTNYFITFGQTVAHDLIHTKESTGGDYSGTTSKCDCYNLNPNNPDCISLPIQAYDVFYKSNNISCLSFLRSQASVIDFDCNLGPREQLNTYTSYLDLGFVYSLGESSKNPDKPYLLKTSLNKANEQTFPQNSETSCQFSHFFPKYTTPDLNGEQNIYQMSSQVIWLRNHNLLAESLKTSKPGESDRVIFEEARRINIAIYQHIVYNEYIPNTLGAYTSKKYNLWPLTYGYYSGYDDAVYPQIYNEFAVAAFRHHTMVGNQQCKADKNYYITQCSQISSGMLDSSQACDSLDVIARGQIATPSYYSTPQVSWVMNNWLLRQMDSIGVKNILRGRDHGIRGYVFYRQWCGLGLARSFDDLKEIPYSVRNQLKIIYAHVNDVELWIGGFTELPIKDGLIGPTFSCIIGRQFSELKRGDRFYYENDVADNRFTLDQLTSIRGVLLASVLCKNLDIDTVPKWPFLYPHPRINPYHDCSRFPDYNLKPFTV